MKFRVLLITVILASLLGVLATAVIAQEEPPSPYTGLENPFPWSDASAQEVGEGIYQQFCRGCHGIDGNSIDGVDFGAVDFPQGLEERPDYYFWTLSEGRLNKGMPPFKYSLSEERRWLVLTYLGSFGVSAPPETPLPTQPPPGEVSGASLFVVTVPEQIQSGQSVVVSAILQDDQGKPIENVPVKFFIRADFFTSGLMEIGEAIVNGQGVAIFEYIPRQTGEIQIVASYGSVENTVILTVAEADELFYRTEAGLHPPILGGEVFIGPESAVEPGEVQAAPMTALRIPNSLVSWPLLAYVLTVILVWGLYLRGMYQVFRIPIVGEIRGTDTRLIPVVGFVVMIVFVTLLVWVLVTGPYTHFHLPP